MVFGTSHSEIVQTEFWLLIISSPTIVASIFISTFLLITIGASRANATSSESTDNADPNQSHSNNDDWLTGIDNLISSFQSSSILN